MGNCQSSDRKFATLIGSQIPDTPGECGIDLVGLHGYTVDLTPAGSDITRRELDRIYLTCAYASTLVRIFIDAGWMLYGVQRSMILVAHDFHAANP